MLMEENAKKTKFAYLDKNVSSVRERIKIAAHAAGRNPDDITFLAAIKSAEIAEIGYLCNELKISCIGENRVQQLMSRYDDIKRDGVKLHFIGKLQRNKVKYMIDKVDMIQSVDSIPLASEISQRTLRAGKVIDILEEINIGREPDKSGVMPEEAALLAEYAAKADGVRLRGFMTMAPVCENQGDYRRYFSEMREICIKIWKNDLGYDGYPVLSMGMSGSFEAAIAEGATLLRVGRLLFTKE